MGFTRVFSSSDTVSHPVEEFGVNKNWINTSSLLPVSHAALWDFETFFCHCLTFSFSPQLNELFRKSDVQKDFQSVRVKNLAPSNSIIAFVEAHFDPGNVTSQNQKFLIIRRPQSRVLSVFAACCYITYLFLTSNRLFIYFQSSRTQSLRRNSLRLRSSPAAGNIKRVKLPCTVCMFEKKLHATERGGLVVRKKP